MVRNCCAIALLFGCLTGCASTVAQRPMVVDLPNGICQDTKSGLMWTKARSPIIRDLDDAVSYAGELSIGGYGDWRLPSVTELYDIFYMYDLRQGFGCVMKLEDNYWSATANGEGEAGAWESIDHCGHERQYYSKQSGHVLAVRDGRKIE